MTANQQFRKLLTQAIYRIKATSGKSIREIQNELGEAIGKKGSLIEHWRKGYHPHLVEDLETVALEIKNRAKYDRDWLLDFLQAGNHLSPQTFLNTLFPTSYREILKLPTQKLPNRAALPIGSIMSLTPNQHFVGRSQTLLEIAAYFEDQTTPLSPTHDIVSLCGLGGIGKTQLASEFVHRYGSLFAGGVFWINFEEHETIPRQIAKCGGPGALNLTSNFHNLSLDNQLQLVRSAWQEATPRLLIFDNCEDQDVLAHWRPASGGCRILITSRRSEWDAALNVKTLPMPVLYRHESVALLSGLLKLPQQAHYPVLENIANEIGDLPLALHMAGRYLHRYQRTISPEMYLGWLKEKPSIGHDSMSFGGISPTRHVQNIRRTFALSYDQLDAKIEADWHALAILVRAAQFAPGEPIWVDLLSKTIESDGFENTHLTKIDDGFSRLLELGLVEVDRQNMLRMHRLVAQFVREANPEEVEKTKGIIQSTVLAEASRINAEGQPLPLLDWHVHLRSIVDLGEMANDVHYIRLCNEIGEHFKQVEDYQGAMPYFQNAVMVADAFEDDILLEKAKSYHNFGFVLRELSQLEKAYPYLHEALNIRLAVCQRTHPATAESYNEMGRWYLKKARFAQAETQFMEAMSIGEQALPADHALKADFLNNLGMCFAFRENPQDGFVKVQAAFEMRLRLFGVNHPRTVLSLNNMGYVLRDLARFEEAKAYYERAHDVNQTIFGELHPKTAVTLINLGDVKIKLNAYPEAKSDLFRAIDVYVVMQDKKHLLVGSAYFNLGLVAEEEKEIDEAINYFGHSLDIRKEKLGNNHPRTKLTRKRLQNVMQKRAS